MHSGDDVIGFRQWILIPYSLRSETCRSRAGPSWWGSEVSKDATDVQSVCGDINILHPLHNILIKQPPSPVVFHWATQEVFLTHPHSVTVWTSVDWEAAKASCRTQQFSIYVVDICFLHLFCTVWFILVLLPWHENSPLGIKLSIYLRATWLNLCVLGANRNQPARPEEVWGMCSLSYKDSTEHALLTQDTGLQGSLTQWATG